MSYRVKSNYRRLGDYIELIDERNVDLEITLLLGLSISKQFIPSVANIIGTDMRNYKIIRRGQFACSIMQVRRDGKMPVALLSEFEEAIISQAYPVFRVKDESLLLPEYLMMWFSRSEFDRQATFHAVGGVRGSLEWEDFLNFELPIPSLEKQNEIVREYNTIVNRINLNETLNQKLEETAQALYKHWFVDFEFPNENGEPYKSSGGEMVYCEEVDGEVPEGWEVVELNKLVQTQYGYTEKASKEEIGPKFIRITDIAQNHINWSEVPFCKISEKDFEKYQVHHGDILVARTGATAGYAKRIHKNFPDSVFASFLVRMVPNDKILNLFIGLIVDNQSYRDFVISNAEGSAQPQANATLLTSLKVINPENSIISKFNLIIEPFFDLIESYQLENLELSKLEVFLLSKMTKIEAVRPELNKASVISIMGTINK